MAGASIIDRLPAPLGERLQTVFASPAVQRARPAILAGTGLAAAAGLWLALAEPNWRPLYPGLSEADAAAVATALQAGNFRYRINADTGAIEVADADAAAARILLAGQGLPQSARTADPLATLPLGASRNVEAARLQSALAADLAASVEAIDGVKAARVHLARPEPSVFIRDRAPASAGVFVTMAPGRVLGEAQVRAIVWLVATSVPGLTPDKVSVVDQSGTLLSAGAAGDARHLSYQTSLEAHVRERLAKLLTPLLGQGRFTAEVAADIDFSQSEASSERFQPAGTLRTETASRSLDTSPPPARGIPGALSNTAPAGAQLTATPPPVPAAPPATPQVTQEQTSRAWEIGKDVSVTRGEAPRLRRLTVAVVLDKGRATPQELAQLTRLVQGAVGYDQARGDLVEVQARTFAAPAPEAPVPMIEQVRQQAPLIGLGLLVLVLLAGAAVWAWRRRRASRASLAEVTVPAPVDGGDLIPASAAVDYGTKLGQTRSLVDSDADRATAVARQMLIAPPVAEPAA